MPYKEINGVDLAKHIYTEVYRIVASARYGKMHKTKTVGFIYNWLKELDYGDEGISFDELVEMWCAYSDKLHND